MEIFRISQLTFHLKNNKQLINSSDFPPEFTLNEYIRNVKHLTGTKSMCFEGGCGCCVVSIETTDPLTKKTVFFSVNSCLVSIYSCHNWKIETIEGIGNALEGYNPIQKTLASHNGSQCGFCSPGMVMNMYSLLKQGNVTKEKIENSFGGNICRCTGYRPILEAFRSLTVDIEELDVIDPLCNRNCELSETFEFSLSERKWIKAFTLSDLLSVLRIYGNTDYMLVAGNTAKGVYPLEKLPDVYIDVTSVLELLQQTVGITAAVLGANVTLANAITFFRNTAMTYKGFEYLDKIADHIDLIANIPVRNLGTIAGNLMTKYKHNEFPSDIFLLLESIGATLTIIDVNSKLFTMTPEEFLSFNMKGKILLSVTFPAISSSYYFKTYKIMGRSQNTHAIVNAGYFFQLGLDKKINKAVIVYGNINSQFVHAKNTEKHLLGKNLFDNVSLQTALSSLDSELDADDAAPDPPPKSRKGIAVCLYYKFVLSVAPDDKISKQNKSGGQEFVRPLSEGTEIYGTNPSVYPLTEPITKLEALAQTSGSAEYIYDIPEFPHQLYGVFVTAKIKANSTIQTVDASEALRSKDVVAFLDKNDIIGENVVFDADSNSGVTEELFCSGVVRYYHQPIGLILAENQRAAEEGAERVKVTFEETSQKPLLTVRDVLEAQRNDRITMKYNLQPESKGNDVKHVITGTFDGYWQYHFSMETQICVVRPTEDGLDVCASTQWMDGTQASASRVTGLPANRINVSVRRLGGAYGCKLDRNCSTSSAAALAAYKFRRPVRIWLPLKTNMEMIGKRYGNSADYEVGVDANGVVQYLTMKDYQDIGYGTVQDITFLLYNILTNSYDTSTWNLQVYTVITDNTPHTAARAPGSCEGEAVIESIMDHIASELNVDPMQVRRLNIDKNKTVLWDYMRELNEWASLESRFKDVGNYNNNNRWTKKGMSVVLMTFDLSYKGTFTVIVSIYHTDGTVAVAHAGIEMGQGINTKVAQVCAHALGLSLDQVSVKPSNTLVSPNAANTGGSLTTEVVCYAVLEACKILLNRIQPYRDNSSNSWAQLIETCFNNDVDLTATYMFKKEEISNPSYNIYGVCATEVEVDILTGRHQVLRVDILEDVGDSLSPLIDMGQVEGAFIMGLGLWTTEKIQYDNDGKLLTNRTWNYTPPVAKDIPIDFRVRFPKNNPNPYGVLGTKATAEPPLCLSVSVPLAIRSAVSKARIESNSKANKWYKFDGPSTVDNTFDNCLNDYKQFTF